MTAYCVKCGARVRQRLFEGVWSLGRCDSHPGSKRFSDGFVERRFAFMRAEVNRAKKPNHEKAKHGRR